MKQYTKPTATVVELSVKENIAALPAVLGSYGDSQSATIKMGGNSVTLTTYNLTNAQTSDGSM